MNIDIFVLCRVSIELMDMWFVIRLSYVAELVVNDRVKLWSYGVTRCYQILTNAVVFVVRVYYITPLPLLLP